MDLGSEKKEETRYMKNGVEILPLFVSMTKKKKEEKEETMFLFPTTLSCCQRPTMNDPKYFVFLKGLSHLFVGPFLDAALSFMTYKRQIIRGCVRRSVRAMFVKSRHDL